MLTFTEFLLFIYKKLADTKSSSQFLRFVFFKLHMNNLLGFIIKNAEGRRLTLAYSRYHIRTSKNNIEDHIAAAVQVLVIQQGNVNNVAQNLIQL